MPEGVGNNSRHAIASVLPMLSLVVDWYKVEVETWDIKLPLQLINMGVIIIIGLLQWLVTSDGIEILDRFGAANCHLRHSVKVIDGCKAGAKS